jgi:periplasmic divalent cation tolerance protein
MNKEESNAVKLSTATDTHPTARRPMSSLEPLALRLVLTTWPDLPGATSLANTLVNEGLAACVNILPAMQSVYRWKGAVETGTEHQILVKCRAEAVPALIARIKSLHPYELPEIIAIPITDGLPAYLNWIHHPDSTP